MIIAGLAALAQASYYGLGGGYGYGHSIPLAVYSNHHVNAYDVPSYGYVKPVYVHVGAQEIPVYMNFESKSSRLYPSQHHIGQPGSYQESYSEDGAHVLKHLVKKPVYQEVREVITPYRKIVQEIKPVHEEIQTLVARKAYGHGGGYGHGGHGGYGHGGYGHGGGYPMHGGYEHY